MYFPLIFVGRQTTITERGLNDQEVDLRPFQWVLVFFRVGARGRRLQPQLIRPGRTRNSEKKTKFVNCTSVPPSGPEVHERDVSVYRSPIWRPGGKVNINGDSTRNTYLPQTFLVSAEIGRVGRRLLCVWGSGP